MQYAIYARIATLGTRIKMDGGMEKLHEKNCLVWLQTMALFCEELYAFVRLEVPDDANPLDYAKVPEAAVRKRHLYENLLEACGWGEEERAAGASSPRRRKGQGGTCQYMTGIPCNASPECRRAVEFVQGLAAETYCMINTHPVLGVFRAAEEGGKKEGKREDVSMFFEQPLFTCMALGTEHAWIELRECRRHARGYLNFTMASILMERSNIDGDGSVE